MIVNVLSLACMKSEAIAISGLAPFTELCKELNDRCMSSDASARKHIYSNHFHFLFPHLINGFEKAFWKFILSKVKCLIVL